MFAEIYWCDFISSYPEFSYRTVTIYFTTSFIYLSSLAGKYGYFIQLQVVVSSITGFLGFFKPLRALYWTPVPFKVLLCVTKIEIFPNICPQEHLVYKCNKQNIYRHPVFPFFFLDFWQNSFQSSTWIYITPFTVFSGD